MTIPTLAGAALALTIHGASQGADLGSTLMLRAAAERAGSGVRFVEYNPGLRGQDPGTVAGMKALELTTVVLVDQMLERRHKTGWVWVLRGADVLGSGYLASRHLGLVRKVGRR